eukprot:COSAG01_NODE_3151_length_6502_cov_6.673903_3_plen_110_part_00
MVVDCATDLWSLGVVLFWALSGRVPFAPTEKDRNKIAYAITHEAAPRLGALCDVGAVSDGEKNGRAQLTKTLARSTDKRPTRGCWQGSRPSCPPRWRSRAPGASGRPRR